MRARTLVTTAAAFVLLPLALIGEVAMGPKAQSQQPVRKVDMGDYEPVVPWPQPLPDTDLSHAGWTWGSGAGVWAESPDKVWVAQRGEIELVNVLVRRVPLPRVTADPPAQHAMPVPVDHLIPSTRRGVSPRPGSARSRRAGTLARNCASCCCCRCGSSPAQAKTRAQRVLTASSNRPGVACPRNSMRKGTCAGLAIGTAAPR